MEPGENGETREPGEDLRSKFPLAASAGWVVEYCEKPEGSLALTSGERKAEEGIDKGTAEVLMEGTGGVTVSATEDTKEGEFGTDVEGKGIMGVLKGDAAGEVYTGAGGCAVERGEGDGRFST